MRGLQIGCACILFVINCLFVHLVSSQLKTTIINGEIQGEILAFADVNYDRFTDLIVKRKDLLVIYKAIPADTDIKFVEKSRFVEDPNYAVDFTGYGHIANVAVGDFNADSFPDLLVSTYRPESKHSPISVTICWGNHSGFRASEFGKFNFSQEPMIINCDDDPISDILAIELNGTLTCYLGQPLRHDFAAVALQVSDSRLVADAAHGFVDITGDLNADLVVQTVNPASDSNRQLPRFEIWTRAGSGVAWVADPSHRIPDPSTDPKRNAAPTTPDRTHPLVTVTDRLSTSTVTGSSPPLFAFDGEQRILAGRAIFDDLNRDGLADLVVPVCHGPSKHPCRGFNLLVWSSGHQRWFWLDVANFKPDAWTFEGANDSPNEDTPHIGPSGLIIRTGDYNQNGYPDLLIVLQSIKNKSNSQAFFVENVACSATNSKLCAEFGRSFDLSLSPVTSCLTVKTATFFDLGEDGTLDILYECYHGPSDVAKNGHTTLEFTTWASDQDTTFLKVQTYTATCGSVCPNGKEGTGISLPGASLAYRMVDTDGNDLSAAYTQQSCTTHKSLLLPYALFGLGRSPNFVDRLILGIPNYPATSQTWPQVVPNSRVYVVPYPSKEPTLWIGRLYITPNRLILLSASALGGVCLLILFFIVVLQCYEMRQDKKERNLLKKRFHFDAM